MFDWMENNGYTWPDDSTENEDEYKEYNNPESDSVWDTGFNSRNINMFTSIDYDYLEKNGPVFGVSDLEQDLFGYKSINYKSMSYNSMGYNSAGVYVVADNLSNMIEAFGTADLCVPLSRT